MASRVSRRPACGGQLPSRTADQQDFNERPFPQCDVIPPTRINLPDQVGFLHHIGQGFNWLTWNSLTPAEQVHVRQCQQDCWLSLHDKQMSTHWKRAIQGSLRTNTGENPLCYSETMFWSLGPSGLKRDTNLTIYFKEEGLQTFSNSLFPTKAKTFLKKKQKTVSQEIYIMASYNCRTTAVSTFWKCTNSLDFKLKTSDFPFSPHF